jgi:hypothetical protein
MLAEKWLKLRERERELIEVFENDINILRTIIFYCFLCYAKTSRSEQF